MKEENHPLTDPAPQHFNHPAQHLPVRKQDVRKVQNNPNRVSEKKRGQGYKEDRTEQPHSTATHSCKSRFELVRNAVQEKTGRCNPHGYGTRLERRSDTVSLVLQAEQVEEGLEQKVENVVLEIGHDDGVERESREEDSCK
ncbi:hypothetical protein RHGRI_030065 [Rhododendron griersonianum]|uniref:Uncharacterized protein n=1 Tax=Rhododendron griersonianum TaxID=479676 RepID=A0AAV6IM41_9ERIC|nr:hypothetical protein RHGRI_030065 [Rhododendron griersonianum]